MEDFLTISKSAVVVVFFVAYCAILFQVLRPKGREMEDHRNIPLRDDD